MSDTTMTPEQFFDELDKLFGCDDGYLNHLQRIKDLKVQFEGVKEGLAQKFYKHYDEMDYDKMYIAKTVGPHLGNMVDHLMEENKTLKQQLEEIKDLKEENEKLEAKILRIQSSEEGLQKEFDDKEHWQQTMVAFMDDGDQWCNFDRWFSENIDEYDKKQDWVKEWMENTEYQDSDEEDE